MKGHGRSIRYEPYPDHLKRSKGFISICGAWKQMYVTKKDAEKVAVHQSELNKKPLSVYRCHGHWHITSRKK